MILIKVSNIFYYIFFYFQRQYSKATQYKTFKTILKKDNTQKLV